MYFVAATIELRPRKDAGLPLTAADGERAHAAVLQAITSKDEEAGRALHEARRHKRMTVAIVSSGRDAATLRVTFADREGMAYASLLVSALSDCRTLRLGRAFCDVDSVGLTDPRWSRVSTWADLVPGTSARCIHFEFATPTAITKRGDDGRRFTSLFPLPRDVFCGLARRWRALDGPALPDDLEAFIHAGGCVAADHAVRTLTFRASRRTQKGFVGWVRYECLRQEARHVAALNGLANLAFFTGVGYQTARGMGAVQTRVSN